MWEWCIAFQERVTDAKSYDVAYCTLIYFENNDEHMCNSISVCAEVLHWDACCLLIKASVLRGLVGIMITSVWWAKAGARDAKWPDRDALTIVVMYSVLWLNPLLGCFGCGLADMSWGDLAKTSIITKWWDDWHGQLSPSSSATAAGHACNTQMDALHRHASMKLAAYYCSMSHQPLHTEPSF